MKLFVIILHARIKFKIRFRKNVKYIKKVIQINKEKYIVTPTFLVKRLRIFMQIHVLTSVI